MPEFFMNTPIQIVSDVEREALLGNLLGDRLEQVNADPQTIAFIRENPAVTAVAWKERLDLRVRALDRQMQAVHDAMSPIVEAIHATATPEQTASLREIDGEMRACEGDLMEHNKIMAKAHAIYEAIFKAAPADLKEKHAVARTAIQKVENRPAFRSAGLCWILASDKYPRGAMLSTLSEAGEKLAYETITLDAVRGCLERPEYAAEIKAALDGVEVQQNQVQARDA
ncbi:MAG: hypothetical protein WAZ18_02975 [Alphaproteobacteria bacterium]